VPPPLTTAAGGGATVTVALPVGVPLQPLAFEMAVTE
jgi:hypothetical protein